MGTPAEAEGKVGGIDGPLLVALLLVGMLFAALFLAIVPRFDTNDDAGMMLIASGFTYGSPSEHLIFTHVLIGRALRSLYELQPDVPWYAAYLYATQIAAWVLIFRALLVMRPAGPVAIALLLGLLTFGLLGVRMMALPQFTSTSMTLAAAALFHHLATARRNESIGWPVAGGILLACASLIRFDALPAVLFFALPALLVAAPRIPLRRNFAFALALGITLGAAGLADRAAYGGDERWREFRDINDARMVLKRMGRPVPSVLQQVGWTLDEYRLFESWYYVDRERYSADKIRSVAASIERPLRNGLTVLKNPTLGAHLPLLAALSLALAFWAPRGARPRLLAVWIWIFLAAAAVQFWFSQIEERVALPAVLVTWLSSVLVCGVPAPRGLRSSRWKTLAAGATAVVLCVGVLSAGSELRGLIEMNRVNRAKARMLEGDLHALELIGSGQAFVHWPPSLAWKYLSPFQRTSRLPRPILIELGWQVNSPPWLDHLDDLGIASLSEAMATGRDVQVLCSRECGPERIRMLSSHLRERHNLGGRLEPRRPARFPAILLWQAVPGSATVEDASVGGNRP